jgi:hypothetical protein
MFCLGLFAGDAFAVQSGFNRQIERFRREREFMLGDVQTVFSSFHGGLGVKIACLAKARTVAVAHNHMVKHFDFQKLPGAD